MTTAKGRETPEEVVLQFVTFLNERKLSAAYWLLTGPERAMTPLNDWISKDWDSPDDKMEARITEINIRVTDRISEQEALVEAELELLDDPGKIKTSYATRLERGGWYVYLGLDHPRGSWTFRRA